MANGTTRATTRGYTGEVNDPGHQLPEHLQRRARARFRRMYLLSMPPAAVLVVLTHLLGADSHPTRRHVSLAAQVLLFLGASLVSGCVILGIFEWRVRRSPNGFPLMALTRRQQRSARQDIRNGLPRGDGDRRTATAVAARRLAAVTPMRLKVVVGLLLAAGLGGMVGGIVLQQWFAVVSPVADLFLAVYLGLWYPRYIPGARRYVALLDQQSNRSEPSDQ